MHLPVLVPRRLTDRDRARAGARDDDNSAAKKSALAILHEADAALAGWSCASSTECCRFSVTGREPWVTEAEWRVVVDGMKRSGKKLAAFVDAIDHDDDASCPFLSSAGKCTIYASRPLGCRTFFCERARGPHGESAHDLPTTTLRTLPRKLDALSTEKSRPLRSWLRTMR